MWGGSLAAARLDGPPQSIRVPCPKAGDRNDRPTGNATADQNARQSPSFRRGGCQQDSNSDRRRYSATPICSARTAGSMPAAAICSLSATLARHWQSSCGALKSRAHQPFERVRALNEVTRVGNQPHDRRFHPWRRPERLRRHRKAQLGATAGRRHHRKPAVAPAARRRAQASATSRCSITVMSRNRAALSSRRKSKACLCSTEGCRSA